MTQAEVRRRFIRAYPGVKRFGHRGLWYRCAHCGKWCGRSAGDNVKIRSDDVMEVDHILPWSSGGSDELYNLQSLCRPCNRSKSNSVSTGDTLKIIKNGIVHGDILGTVARKSVRNSKILKSTGISKRR